MKRMSLQWRLTCITTLCIAIICGCLTMFVYKNGVYYIDSLQKAVNAQGDDSTDNSGNDSEEIYISIPEDKWDEFSNEMGITHGVFFLSVGKDPFNGFFPSLVKPLVFWRIVDVVG